MTLEGRRRALARYLLPALQRVETLHGLGFRVGGLGFRV
jgi:hypothetical protein